MTSTEIMSHEERIITDLRDAVTAQENRNEHLCGLLEAAHARHQEFRTAVRDHAIDTHKSGEWCLEGTNDGLSTLGLPQYNPVQTGRVTITAYVRVTDTESEGVARSWIRDNLTVQSSDSDVEVTSFEIDDIDDLEIEDGE